MKLYNEIQTELSIEQGKINNLKTQLNGDVIDSITSIQSTCEYYIQRINRLKNNINEEDFYIMHNKCTYLKDTIESLIGKESNLLHSNKEKISINKMVDKCIEKCKQLSQEKNIRIIRNEKEYFHCFVDPSKIEDLLIQIIETALNFSHTNDEIEITLSKQGNHAHISVRDYGLGMSDKTIYELYSNERILDKVNLRPTEIRKFNFYLGRKIALEHQGVLSLESKKGFGTLYTLKLPVSV